MLRNVKVTKRDLQLLKDVYDNSFLSFYQIHEEHFATKAKPTVYNRISKLVQANLIEAMNINLFAHHRKNELIGVIYGLTRKGIDVLNHYLQGKEFQFNSTSLNLSCLYHDLLLTDVLRVSKRKHSQFEVINTTSNLSAFKVMERVPDAILFDPRNKTKMALELELTSKSEARYRDIVLSYRMSNEYEKVLYVVKDQSIQQKIGGVITGFKGNYSIGDDTDKFNFAVLPDYMINVTKDGINEL